MQGKQKQKIKERKHIMLKQCEMDDSDSQESLFDRKEARKQADEKFDYFKIRRNNQGSQNQPGDSRLIKE